METKIKVLIASGALMVLVFVWLATVGGGGQTAGFFDTVLGWFNLRSVSVSTTVTQDCLTDCQSDKTMRDNICNAMPEGAGRYCCLYKSTCDYTACIVIDPTGPDGTKIKACWDGYAQRCGAGVKSATSLTPQSGTCYRKTTTP